MQKEELLARAAAFSERLRAIKSANQTIPWYLYDSLANLWHFSEFRRDGIRVFDFFGPNNSIVDVGAADGDLAFFLETLGCKVLAVDNPATNNNGGRALTSLRAELRSAIEIAFVDLDAAQKIPGIFDLALFMGTLYHLRNPALALSSLAENARFMALSTKVFFKLPSSRSLLQWPFGKDISDLKLAYLLDEHESNNDTTNWWLLTPAAVRALLERCGWAVRDEYFSGDEHTASLTAGDCRMFCFCERKT